MASFVKYECLSEDIANEEHDFFGTNDTLKIALTNSAPNVATHRVLSDITEISAGNGYTAGGHDVQNDGTRSGGTTTVTGVDVTITASGGDIGPFRYGVLYNDTSATDALIGYWDRGASITLTGANGDSVTWNFGASLFTVA